MAEQKINLSTKIPEHVLVIAAHADDIEFGAAGSIARWVDEGAKVTYCLVTDGSAGSNEPDADLAEGGPKLIAARRDGGEGHIRRHR